MAFPPAAVPKMTAMAVPVDAASAAMADPKIATCSSARTLSRARRCDCGAIQIAYTEAIKSGPPMPRTSLAGQLEWSRKR